MASKNSLDFKIFMIIIIASTLLSISCSPTNSISKYEKLEKDVGIVIVKFTMLENDFPEYTNLPSYITVSKKIKGDKFSKKKIKINLQGKSINLYMKMKSGIYRIEDFVYPSFIWDNVIAIRGPNYDASGEKAFFKFVVHPGRINYLGDVSIKVKELGLDVFIGRSHSFNLNIEDNFKDAVDLFNKEYPYLSYKYRKVKNLIYEDATGEVLAPTENSETMSTD